MSDKQTLSEVFKNNSDCYADNGISLKVIQAMTEEKFIEVVSKLKAIEQTPSGYCRWVGIDFAKFLEECTEVVHEEKITLYRYCDGNNEYGNYILDDIYTVYEEKYLDIKPPPSTIDARKIASDAWDAAIERFCYENGSEFVEGKPLKKFDYLSNL